MSATAGKARSVRIGLLAGEPIRVAGLASVFELPARPGKPQLIPVTGTAEELLAHNPPAYIVVDLHASAGMAALESLRHVRPDIRLIVIGPEGDDELVMRSIIAGARAYLDPTVGPEVVREAIEVVTSGSIWAPRRLLSRLIDRLLKVPDAAGAAHPQLTVRERQVLELILMARSNREIAAKLGIDERTVKAYVGRLMRKTGADNRIKLSMSPISLALFPGDRMKEIADASGSDFPAPEALSHQLPSPPRAPGPSLLGTGKGNSGGSEPKPRAGGAAVISPALQSGEPESKTVP